MTEEPRWVAFVHGADRTGTLTALAGVFSTRGVSFESLTTSQVGGGVGLIVVTFVATERRQRLLTRTVERLAAVRSVQVRAADDPGVRAAGVVHLPAGVPVDTSLGADLRWSGAPDGGGPVIVEGPLVQVERVVADALSAGATAVATVILALPPE